MDASDQVAVTLNSPRGCSVSSICGRALAKERTGQLLMTIGVSDFSGRVSRPQTSPPSSHGISPLSFYTLNFSCLENENPNSYQLTSDENKASVHWAVAAKCSPTSWESFSLESLLYVTLNARFNRGRGLRLGHGPSTS